MLLAKKLNKGAGTIAVPADAQFNYVTMLLHGDGTNGAQNNTFVDSSSSPFSITRNGNTTQGSFSPYGSNWSNYFSDGAYLSVPNNAVFNPGSGDFTVEAMFVRTVNTGGSQTIIAKYETSWQASYSIVIVGDTWDVYMTYGVGSYTLIYSGAAPAVGVWSHMALQRSGSYWEFYCNGVRLAQVTAYTIASTTSAIRIGELGAGYSGYSFNGHISNVRIRNGYATYSGSTYTVPTANLTAITGTVLLTCQSNRFIDNSSNNFTVTSGTVSTGTPSVQRFNPFGTSTAYSTSVIGGSAYYDASGDSLSTPASSANNPQSGDDYTVEAWIYITVVSGITSIYSGDTVGYFAYRSAGRFEFVSSTTELRLTFTAPLNQWCHVAVTRQSGTLRMFINGALTSPTVASGSATGNTDTLVGASTVYYFGSYTNSTSGPFGGYISNFRIVKGTAVYTAAFTPPTAPLTAVTNTAILLNNTNGAIFDNAMMNNLETVGNAQISTSVVKYGTGSMYNPADTTGAGIRSRNSGVGTITGDFTIEWWAYHINLSSGSNHVMMGPWGINGSPLLVRVDSGANYQIYMANASRLNISVASSGIVATTWQHYAITRSGSTCYAFVNGVLVGSTWTMSDSLDFSTVSVLSENAGVSLVGDQMNGYMDDVRITKGYARYTTTFTPPTSALSDTGPI